MHIPKLDLDPNKKLSDPEIFLNIIPECAWSRRGRFLGPIASEDPTSKGENPDRKPSFIRPKWTAGRRLLCLIITGGAVRSPISPTEWNQLDRGHAGRHGARLGDLVHAQASDRSGPCIGRKLFGQNKSASSAESVG